jgi:hypothetical protein
VNLYLLQEDGEVVRVLDTPKARLAWVMWFGNIANRCIARTKISDPVLFESLVLRSHGASEETYRYHTKNQALKGHKDLVEMLLREQESCLPLPIKCRE